MMVKPLPLKCWQRRVIVVAESDGEAPPDKVSVEAMLMCTLKTHQNVGGYDKNYGFEFSPLKIFLCIIIILIKTQFLQLNYQCRYVTMFHQNVKNILNKLT